MKNIILITLSFITFQVFAQNKIEIPVKMHLVSDATGKERLSELEALDYLCELNDTYADSDFHFYLNGDFSYINSSVIFHDIISKKAVSEIDSLRDKTSINIFFASELKSSNKFFLDGFYNPQADWIFIQFDASRKYSQLLGHMVAHYFGVSHCSGQSYFTNQGLENLQDLEYQDGSNCDVAGDKICDTPPDYGVYVDSVENCTFTVNVLDYNGAQIHPMVNNLMSSFYPNHNTGCEKFVFTQGQYDKMYKNYESSSRDYLKGAAPEWTEITTKPTLIAPINLVEVNPSNGVKLDWDDLEGAESYIIEIARHTFDFDYQTFVSKVSEIEIPNLEFNKKYIWRVTPFNGENTCIENWTSEEGSFKTIEVTDVEDFAKIKTNIIISNPVSTKIHISLASLKNIDCEIEILNIQGQLVQKENLKISKGQNNFNIDVENLSNGIHFLNFKSADLLITKKIVVRK